MWTIINEAEKSRYYNCRCDCGTERMVYGPNLKNGKSISCGCQRINKQKSQGFDRVKEIIGEQFGLLTVIEDLGNNRQRTTRDLRCQCACGKIIIRRMSTVLNGMTKSCGCLNSMFSSERARSRNSRTIRERDPKTGRLIPLRTIIS